MKKLLIKGKGSDLTDKKLQQNRGKKKMITHVIIRAMLEIAERKGNKRFIKSLWNAYYCLDKVTTGEGRMYTTYYCKSRICTVCAGNRKADLINKYYPIIQKWEQPYFVTLTVKAIPAKNLNKWINDGMIRGFNRIVEKYRKQNLRGNGMKLIGIRTLECNFNSKKRTYNPHFHIIVANKQMAETLINEWLQLWRSDNKIFTVRKAQDMRPIESLERDLIETIKYGTKIFTQPDPDKRKRVKGSERIYAVAIYNVLNAMKGRHLMEHFGFKTPVVKKEKTDAITLTDSENWKYDPAKLDWGNELTDEVLMNFSPSPELIRMSNELDCELE